MPGEFRLSPESERALQRTMLQRQDRFQQARSTVTENEANRLVFAQQYAPTASPELKQAFAATPMTPDQLADLAQREAVTVNTHPGFVGRVGDILNGLGMGAYNQVVKPLVRGATTLFEGLAQEVVQRPLTAAMESIRRPDLGYTQAYNEYGDSALVNLAQGDLSPVVDERGEVVEGTGTLGRGFFPAGTAGAETARERQRLQINGQPATLGRAFSAATFGRGGPVHSVSGRHYTPGDSAYDVTAGIAQFTGDVVLDPSAAATLGASRAIGAARGLAFRPRTLGQAVRGLSPAKANDLAQQIKATGAITGGRRNTVLADRVERLIRNRNVLDQIAGDDAYQIFRNMKGNRLGVGRNSDDMADLIGRLGETSDRNEVAEILLESVRKGWVRETGFYAGTGRFVPNVKSWARSLRVAADDAPEFRHGGVNPARIVSPSNRMQSAVDIDAMLRISKVGESERARIFQRAIQVNGPDEMLDVVDDATRSVAKKMEDVGVDPDDVEEILTASRQNVESQTSYLLEQTGAQSPPPWSQVDEVTIGGNVKELTAPPKASLLTHLNRQMIPLFDPKDLRRATQKHKALRSVYQSNGWEMADAAARWTTKYLFKFPTLFTRLAYPLRNNLDNQARAAGAGYVSLFTNPVAYMSMGIRNPNRFREVLTSADGALTRGRGFRTGDGRYGVVDEIIGEGTPDARVRATITRGPDGKETKESIEANLAEFREQEVVSVARTFREVSQESGHLTRDAAGMWQDRATMKTGNHKVYQKGVDDSFVRAWREQLGQFHADPVVRRVANTSAYATKDELVDQLIDYGVIDEFAKFAGDDAERFFFPERGELPDRGAVEQYVDWTEGHIEDLTGGSQGLRQTIATGDLNGVDFNDLTRNNRINQILREQYEDFAPQYVSGSELIDSPHSRSRNLFKRGMDGWVDIMASKPENFFTRHPLMAQIFADDLAHMMPTLADDTVRASLVRKAADAGFDGRRFRHVAQAAQDAAGQNGIVDSLDDALEAAKLHSGDRMLDIAFDASRRSSFQEMADVVFPFYDAFVEVAQSWGKILRDNPNAFIRGTAAYDSLRTQGQFYVNEHGAEVFQYPGGGLVAKALGLDRAQPGFEANVSGLNLVVQGFGPGFGPVVQWAAGAFMPDSPDLQWARDIMFPFGTAVDEPGDLLTGEPLKELMPAWAEKSINAYTEGDWDESAFNSAVGDAIKAIATTRPHDPSDPEQVDQLIEDATSAAKWTMFIRSALQMGMPTGPSVEWEIQNDPDGDTHRVAVLASAYYEMLEESGGDHQATNEAFIELYGHEPFWIAQGKTRELIEGPRTREGFNWIASHPDAADAHKEVIGYFVPAEDPEAVPDYSVYQQRLESGEIDSLTGEQQYALANKTKARQIYYAQRERIEADPNTTPTAKRDQLKAVRTWLTDMFPGWNTESIGGLGSRLERDEQIRLLEQAVADPALADSPTTEPLSIYLAKRNEVEAILAQRAEQGGPSTLAADANSDLREWLYGIGTELSVRSGEFRSMWQTLLASEVDDS